MLYSKETPSTSKATPRYTLLQLMNDKPMMNMAGRSVPMAIKIRLTFFFENRFNANNLSLNMLNMNMNRTQAT